jgi:aryl-alcohol dehydrogenase-like predicted oxidoreductase
MEHRRLGNSGLQVSVLSLGTATFGAGEMFQAWGSQPLDEARRFVDVCLDAGVTLFDTADAYSHGGSEEVLGKAVRGKRDKVLLATKAFGRMGQGANDAGLSRLHLIKACEDSLRRLGTDYIDLYQSHGFDALTPLDETLEAFQHLVQAGKVRYVGCSNYSAWHLMKALSTAKETGGARYVSQQVYYSLVGRELEYELVPLSLDQGVGILVWSPLAAGFLTGKYRRDQQPTEARRLAAQEPAVALSEDRAWALIDLMAQLADGYRVSVAQVALNWLLRKPGVTSVILGARTMEQLQDTLNTANWKLSDEDVVRLDEASDLPAPYPYWHQRKYGVGRNPMNTSKQ